MRALFEQEYFRIGKYVDIAVENGKLNLNSA